MGAGVFARSGRADGSPERLAVDKTAHLQPAPERAAGGSLSNDRRLLASLRIPMRKRVAEALVLLPHGL